MNPADVLKEYLVKLGFEIDGPGQVKIRQALKELETALNSLGRNQAMTILTKGALGFVGAIATVTIATAKLMEKTAEADLNYEKLALRMHMTKDAAKQLSLAQESLGASLEEIVWNPELRKHYHELRSIVRETTPGKEGENAYRQIRDVGFEFTKMKLMAKSGVEWIVTHLAKMLDLTGMKKKLQGVTEWLKKNLPDISKKIADFLYRVIGVGKTLVMVLKGVWDMFKGLVNVLPEGAAKFLLFIGAIAAGLKLNPTIMMLAGLFLLIEDFYTYMDAKKKGEPVKAVFGDLWETLNTMFEPLKDSLKDLNKVFKEFDSNGLKLHFWNAFAGIIRIIAAGVATIVHGLTTIMRIGGHFARIFASQDQAKIINKEFDEKLSSLEQAHGVPKNYTGDPETFIFNKNKSKYKEYQQARAQIEAQRKNKLESIYSGNWDLTLNQMSKDTEVYYDTLNSLRYPHQNYQMPASDLNKQYNNAGKIPAPKSGMVPFGGSAQGAYIDPAYAPASKQSSETRFDIRIEKVELHANTESQLYNNLKDLSLRQQKALGATRQ